MRLVFTLYRMHFLTNFLQTWYKSWYWDGVSWDCRWVNLDKYVQSYGPWFTLQIGFRSLSLAFLYRFSSNFAWELILGRSVLRLQMGKFRQNVQSYGPWFGPWFMLLIGFHSLSLAFLYWFFSNFAWELILGRSVLGLQIGKFQQICTELWPLIYVINWFSLSIFGISLQIFFKLCVRVYIGKECLAIADV